MIENSRSLRQEELDAYYRLRFVSDILDFIAKGNRARFVTKKNHLTLIEIRPEGMNLGEWTISIGGNSRYTYHYSHVVDVLEQIYNSGADILHLKGEVVFRFERVTANPDADPDTTSIHDSAADDMVIS